jgi:hypothetical protein
MTAQIIFALVMIGVFVGWQLIKPGRSIFDR